MGAPRCRQQRSRWEVSDRPTVPLAKNKLWILGAWGRGGGGAASRPAPPSPAPDSPCAARTGFRGGVQAPRPAQRAGSGLGPKTPPPGQSGLWALPPPFLAHGFLQPAPPL